jgi:hypothetical protein
MSENQVSSIVYDMVLLEADRIKSYKMKELDLFYRDKYGDIKLVAEGYNKEVEEVVTQLLKKKKMRYMITFLPALDVMDDLKPSANKLLRFFVKQMNYGNKLEGFTIRDIQKYTGIHLRYLLNAMTELYEKDVVRFTTHRAKRTYMVNPMYYYKGTMKRLFFNMKAYNSMPIKGEEKPTQKTKVEEDIFS